MIKLDLNGMWRMKSALEEDWIPAQVPGSVASDLLRAGLIPDPYYKEQEYEVFGHFYNDYEYEREFWVEPSLLEAADQLELCCEGLDTIADIHLNGVQIAHTFNMHRTYRFAVGEFITPGHNLLHIRFHSPVQYVERKQKELALWAANGDYVVQGFPHLRKAHHMFGWDWGPKLPDSGIWRDIYLAAYEKGRLDDVYITQKHQESGSVMLDIRVSVEQYGNAPLELITELTAPDGTRLVSDARPVAGGTDHIQLHVDEPELWWPNGLGEQPLYELKLWLRSGSATVDDQVYRVGLRTLTVRNEPDQWGESFEFVINGVSIFAMGANYIPEDNIRDRHSIERTERLIRDCVEAHFNCIRVWGGGFYPDDYFYDLCDQYGLIVWQDHMFACAEYEMNEEFTEEIISEIADNVRRIRHHASLGLWCGNNEMEMAWIDWDFPKREKLKTDYVKQFEIIIPEITQAHDPNTFYWKASPSSGGGFDEPNAYHRGDVHYWEVWHGDKKFTEYRKHYFRFCSEFGFQSFPLLKTVRAFTEPGDRNIFTPVMESHQKNEAGNSKILTGISDNFLNPKDFSSLLYVSQLLQAEAMRYGVEHWRRNRGRCMGSIYWQLNDCWPVASWSSLDYYGRWKALHYSAKRFYAPVLLSAEEEGSQVKLCVTNDTRDRVKGTVVWRLRDGSSLIVQQGSIDMEITPLSAREWVTLDFSDVIVSEKIKRNMYVEYELLVDGAAVSDGYALFVKPKHYQLQQPELRAVVTEEDDCFVIQVQASKLALFVELDFANIDAIFEDNYFHVSGGEPKQIRVMKANLAKPASLRTLQDELQIRSLFDSYLTL
ncbi:glycoside hydrolase family 2 protein [Paenibacillus thiaminolyticus]|uniref:beta-mannosidase n=1 Tax=Paenibacillus thiaminolyticus TaxID=49283 RepID=UPI0035A5AAE8